LRYLEDFTAGQKFGGPERVRVEAARIKSFAAEFDPQAFIWMTPPRAPRFSAALPRAAGTRRR